MPHHTPLIGTIVAGLVVAFLFGALAQRLRVPPIAGYLLAGVMVGPFTPGFVADIVRLMKENPAMYSKGGCAVLYPRHGILVAHRSPELAFDLAERVEWNAEAVVYDRLMGTTLPRQLPPHADRPEDPIGESKPAR